MQRRILITALCLALAGCGGTAAKLDRSCSFDEGSVEGPWLPLFGGHSYDWLYLSHRVAYLRAGVDLPDQDGAFDVPLGLIGGDWSTGGAAFDYPWYRVDHTRVSTDVVQGWFGSQQLTVPATGKAELDVSIPFQQAGFSLTDRPENSFQVVVLRGLCFDTDMGEEQDPDTYDAALGWTVRGFGAGVSDVELTDESVDFKVKAHFQAGPLDRGDLAAAIPDSSVNATVAYAILNVPAGHLTEADHSASMFYAAEGEAYTETPLLPEDQRRELIDGPAGYPTAVPLLHSFDFELNAAHDPDRAGRYLRGWHARIDEFEYTPETGRGNFLIDGWASHSSALQEGDLEVEFTTKVSMLQLPEAEQPIRSSGEGWFDIEDDGSIELGSSEERVEAP